MDFIYLLRVLLKRKWIILGAGVVAAVIAYVFTMNEPKKYRSIAQISTGFTISDDIKVGESNFSIYEADTKFNNAIVTATSPSVLSFLSYTLILHDLQDPKPFRVLGENQKQSPIYKEVKKEDAINVFSDKLATMSMLTSFKPEEKKLLEYLKLYGYDYKTVGQSLGVYRMQRTDYIQIDYASENPELSAFVVNSLFQQFLKYYKMVRSSKSLESIDTLRSLMEKKKQELDQKNATLRAAGVTDVAISSASKLELISGLEQTLQAEKSKQTTLYSELKKINQRLAATNTPVTTPVKPGVDNNELLILRNAMNQAYNDYINTGSTDQTLLTKYNNLKAQYQAKALAPLAQGQTQTNPSRNVNVLELMDKKNDLEIDIQSSGITITNLQNQIASLKGSVQAESSKGVAVDVMLKDAALANKEYIEAKEKYNNATDISTSPINNFRQILYGQPAIEPEPSKRKLLIGMAGISAIIVTMLVFVLLTYLDSSVKTPAIFGRVVNLKLISMVNFMNLKHRKLADIVAKKDEGIDQKEKKRHNVFRESLRKLRYEVETSGKKIFLFASTQKGQGKTTLIQALSYSMSLSKKKILIIDTNFSNNDLTVQLNADPILEKIGIEEEKTHVKATLEDIKRMSTDIGGGYIFAIGSEGGDYTPSEILPRENILQHLREYTKEFDYIFLEGPPLNDYSDSMELSQYVDGVIAVFSATHVVKQIDKESMKFFKDLNGKFIGSILNKVDLQDVNAS
jgi:succinoglycan biosynthesis transport protein ExoP